MTPAIRERVVGFIREYPMVGPSLGRFPTADTFWNTGVHRIVFRLLNFYFNYARMLSIKSRVFGYPSRLFILKEEAWRTVTVRMTCPLATYG